jgi:hypothetical protein
MLGSRPWWTAFSTSGCSSSGGSGGARGLVGVDREAQPLFHAHLQQLQVGARQLQLGAPACCRRGAGAQRGAQVVGEGSQHLPAAAGRGPSALCTLASVLNRKCGSICACSSRSCASVARFSASPARALARKTRKRPG